MQREAALRTTVGMSEAGRQGPGGARPTRFCQISTPYLNQGADYAHQLLHAPPPDVQTFLQPWTEVYRSAYYLPEST